MNKEEQLWDRERNSIILSLHEMMLSDEATKYKYHAILERRRSQYRQDDADFLLKQVFPFGPDALQIDADDEDQPQDD